MNSDVMQQLRTHTLPSQQGKDSIVVFGLGWFVVNEKQGKQESLNHYRIIMDMHNVANQKALQECPLNTQQF
jgi:hypothetical protein